MVRYERILGWRAFKKCIVQNSNLDKETSKVKIERLLVIDNPDEQERLWKFYECIFQPVNEQTPIIQTFPKDDFVGFLSNSNVVKFVVWDKGEIVGLGIISYQLDDSWLSPAYFAKNHPGKVICHIPVIAIASEKRNSRLAVRLVKALINEVSENAVVVLTYSELVNPLMPKLVEATGIMDYVSGGKVDAEACLVFRWKDGKVVV